MSLGDWGEGKNKNARGMMGRGKKGRGASALSLFPSYHAHSLFLIFLFLVARGQKALFFKDIAGKMVRHELTNIERQGNLIFQFSQTIKYIRYVVSAVNLNQPVIEANGDNVIYVLHEHMPNNKSCVIDRIDHKPETN